MNEEKLRFDFADDYGKFAKITFDGFCGCTVAGITGVLGGRAVLVIAQMVGQLRFHHLFALNEIFARK